MVAIAVAVIPANAGTHFDLALALASTDEVTVTTTATSKWIPAFAGMTARRFARMREKLPCVYLLASMRGTLYVGVTSNLVQRIWQHRNDVIDSFSKQHGVHLLVWYEVHDAMHPAITREKAIKAWK